MLPIITFEKKAPKAFSDMYTDTLPPKSHYEVSVFVHAFLLLIILTEKIPSYDLPWAEESSV